MPFPRSIVKLVLAAVVAIGFAGVPARAADVNGRIKGTVSDPSGAVVPGSMVTATNQATGVSYATKSNAAGEYLFPELPIGTYTIKVESPGFKTFEAKGILLTIDQEYVESPKLALGSTSEVLQVAADPVQVNTTDMQLDNIVNSSQMVELPLIGRSFLGLELIEPGVQGPSDRFGTSSVSGAQTQQSEYLINGADSNDLALNTLAITPNLDAIDQFNLIEGPLNAEYDRDSGGIVSATIKQGTNQIHGDVFEFYRDTFLNTANYFSTRVSSTGVITKPVTTFHQNIYGGTVGGPIVKDKLFLFFAYQGTHQVVPQAGGSVSVLTQANRTGSFAEDLTPTAAHFNQSFSTNKIPGTITIPGCTPGETWVACLGPTGLNGQVPTSAFNPVSVGLLKYVPLPNNGTYGFSFNPVTTTSANQYMGRTDYALNQANHFYFVGIYQKQVAPETLPFTGATLPGFGDVSSQYIQQYTFDYVHQFNATTVNDFAAHWTRFNYQAVLPQQTLAPSSAGFAINPENTAAESLPYVNVTNFFALGFSTNGPQPRIDQVYQLDDTVSKVAGNHNFKFGYDGRRFNVSNPFSARNNGAYNFSSNSQVSPYTTGDTSLDFLLGVPGTYSQSSGGEIQADAFLNYFFAQDTWRVTSMLTLDYGMGYSIDTPLEEHQYNGKAVICLIGGQQSTVFANAPVGLNYPGDPGCGISAQAKIHYNEFGPRIGFAYTPDLGVLSAGGSHKLAIRGGFGIYYDRTEEETSLQTLTTPPFGQSSGGANDYGTTSVLTPAFANPYQDINTGTAYTNKFPFTFPVPGATINFKPLEPVAKSTYGPGFRAPYAENFQISVEREFPSSMVGRVSYVGSLARRNQVDAEGNYETAAGHANCLATPACVTNASNQMKLYPQNTAYGATDPNTGVTGFTSIGEVSSEGTSNYHALEASLIKGLTHGLQFQLSYTLSHALDNGSGFENSGFGSSGRGYNQYQPGLNYGNSSFDARHRLVFAPVYITPILQGRAWYSPVNLASSGWEVSGILTLATGFPFDVSYAGSSSNSLFCSASNSYYACPDVPVQNGPLQRINPRSPKSASGFAPWFANTGATFTPEPIGTFGNTARNEYHGPGTNNTNMIVAKNFNLSSDGARRLQLRMESDNVFNHTQFSNPVSSVSAYSTSSASWVGNFGLITSAAAGRQTQLAAKIYF